MRSCRTSTLSGSTTFGSIWMPNTSPAAVERHPHQTAAGLAQPGTRRSVVRPPSACVASGGPASAPLAVAAGPVRPRGQLLLLWGTCGPKAPRSPGSPGCMTVSLHCGLEFVAAWQFRAAGDFQALSRRGVTVAAVLKFASLRVVTAASTGLMLAASSGSTGHPRGTGQRRGHDRLPGSGPQRRQ